VAVRVAIAGTFPNPLKLPPVSVTDAPLKEAVGSDFTLTAAIALEDMRTTANTVVRSSPMNFFIVEPFRYGIKQAGKSRPCRPFDKLKLSLPPRSHIAALGTVKPRARLTLRNRGQSSPRVNVRQERSSLCVGIWEGMDRIRRAI
jgi:hypothetical protein